MKIFRQEKSSLNMQIAQKLNLYPMQALKFGNESQLLMAAVVPPSALLRYTACSLLSGLGVTVSSQGTKHCS